MTLSTQWLGICGWRYAVTSPRKTLCFLAAFMTTFVPPTVAQGTYTQIDVPGASFTSCQGVDTAGDIVGFYGASDNEYGFLFSGGSYITIAYPGATGTQLTGINDMGQIVGLTYSPSQIGFLYDVVTQSFTTISYPRAT